MAKQKVNQWSLAEVAQQHNYRGIKLGGYECKDLSVHLVYSHLFANTINGILDIGHGVRPLPYASDIYGVGFPIGLRNYVGAEVNEQVLNICKATQKDFSKRDKSMNLSVKFFKQDVEKRFSKNFSKAVEGCNLVFMDSTLTLMEDPKAFIKKISKRVDWIYLKRTPVVRKTERHEYKWTGMQDASPNWHLGLDFYEQLHRIKSFFFDASTIALDCRDV